MTSNHALCVKNYILNYYKEKQEDDLKTRAPLGFEIDGFEPSQILQL